MQVMTNTKVRIISSTPLQHRADTLRSIGQKAHELSAEIKSLGVKRDKFQQLMDQAPKDGSRLAWIAQRLQD